MHCSFTIELHSKSDLFGEYAESDCDILNLRLRLSYSKLTDFPFLSYTTVDLGYLMVYKLAIETLRLLQTPNSSDLHMVFMALVT